MKPVPSDVLERFLVLSRLGMGPDLTLVSKPPRYPWGYKPLADTWGEQSYAVGTGYFRGVFYE